MSQENLLSSWNHSSDITHTTQQWQKQSYQHMAFQRVTDEWCNRQFIKEQSVKSAPTTHGESEYKTSQSHYWHSSTCLFSSTNQMLPMINISFTKPWTCNVLQTELCAVVAVKQLSSQGLQTDTHLAPWTRYPTKALKEHLCCVLFSVELCSCSTALCDENQTKDWSGTPRGRGRRGTLNLWESLIYTIRWLEESSSSSL